MSAFTKGQPVILTNPRGTEKAGKFVGVKNLGTGRGGGEYLVVDVDGKEMKARASKVRAA
ncbi:hypothetical protein SAMN05660489_02415 [Pseudomonas sp. LAMO17WK12:I10]|uniref:hypothetical protein n=1 Tax=unclassified Pseudomonas TaxID=196821 RepID=UPI000BDA20ED|nr:MULTISPECIES: hypothetical protein [unclassified Pseudomonas]PXX71822.1 hypothetical protein H160_02500 [Pseudomonas sp. LAMO17WK12:I9]SNY29198.1 hypothetical protein SAMN05660489_02415 [Pseudomonas sp. LAMO17WK12:I10]